MIMRRLPCAVLLAALPLPAAASVVVVAGSSATSCYRAADNNAMPTSDDMAQCDLALGGEALSPRDTVATYVNRGILRLRRNDQAGALADFETAMRLDPAEPEAYLNRGATLVRQEAAEPAVAMFSAALERNTRRPELAYYGRGVAYEAMGRVREAYADYVRASELAPRWSAPRADLSRFRVVR